MYQTLDERKRREATRRAGAAELLLSRLEPVARGLGGRYILFGSLAREEARYDSDADILLDFPAEREAEAWRSAESACAELGLPADIRPVAWCKPDFVAKVMSGARVIG